MKSPRQTMSARASTLTEARPAVARGEDRQAIESLTAANRCTASGDMELRLVQWRDIGVSEITAPHVTSAIIGDGLLHHGRVRLRGSVSAARAMELVRGVDRAFAACNARWRGTIDEEDTRWFRAFEPRGAAIDPGRL
jgi:hypothetical protein